MQVYPPVYVLGLLDQDLLRSSCSRRGFGQQLLELGQRFLHAVEHGALVHQVMIELGTPVVVRGTFERWNVKHFH